MADGQKGHIALASIANSTTLSPPLNLLCLSTVLEEAGYKTEILDMAVDAARENTLLAGVKSNKYEWVGFTAMTPMIPLTKKVIDNIRIINPAIPIILGGVHGATLPERTLKELDINAVCVGDGEGPAIAFSHKVIQKETNYWEIPGIAAKDSTGHYHFSEELARARELRSLPRANWERIDLSEYSHRPLQYVKRGDIIAPFITAKGCPLRCSFCVVHAFSGKRLIQREPEEVVAEIEYLVKEKNVSELQLFDDNFNINLNYAKAVLRALAKRKLKLVWKTPNGLWIHSHDDEWFSLLQETGCYQVGFGIESGSSKILKIVDKPIKLPKVPMALQRYRDHGISTFGYFILGLPGETKETMAETINFACQLPMDHLHCSIFTPYPGSPLYEQMAALGTLPDTWEEYFHYHHSARMTHCDLTIQELRRGLKNFYLRFYSRPGRALHLLNDVRHSGVRTFFSLAKKIFV